MTRRTINREIGPHRDRIFSSATQHTISCLIRVRLQARLCAPAKVGLDYVGLIK
jgi:hypothetical protein